MESEVSESNFEDFVMASDAFYEDFLEAEWKWENFLNKNKKMLFTSKKKINKTVTVFSLLFSIDFNI